MKEKVPVLGQIGAVKLGISTLAFLAGVCAFQTIWYDKPELVLGKSWWVRLPLVILALDLLYITVTRFRKSWSQAGMISTHVGLIVILTGSFLTSLLGTTGMMEVGEGETTSRYHDDHDFLAVKENPQALPLLKRLPFEASPDRENVSESLDVPGGTTVTVDKFYDHYRSRDVLKEGVPGGKPCLAVGLRSGEQRGEVHLFDDEEGRARQIGFERINLEFVYLGQRDWHPLLESMQILRMGQLELVRGTGADAKRQKVDVAASMGKDVPIEGTAWTLRLDKFLPNLSVGEDNRASSMDDHPGNPCLFATLTGPDGVRKAHIFPHGVEGPPHEGNVWPEGVMPLYQYSWVIAFVRSAEGRVTMLGTVLDDPKQAQEVPEKGAAIRWLGLDLTTSWFSSATLAAEADDANDEESPAIHVTLRNGTASASRWILLTRSTDPYEKVPLGQGEFQVGFQRRPAEMSVPFQVRLDKFVEDHYEGTSSPMAWHSFLTVTDAEKGKTFQYTVQMNEPLRYRGWKLFQSGKDDSTGRWVSTFSVSWDPGDTFIYIGCVFVVAGVLFLFYFKKPVQAWESRRLERRGAAPKASKAAQETPAPQSVRG